MCKRLLYYGHWRNSPSLDKSKKKRNGDLGLVFLLPCLIRTRHFNFFGVALYLRLFVWVFLLSILDAFQEQKKLKDQLATEQEAMYGSKPNVKKPLGQSTNTNVMAATPNSRRVGTPARFGVSGGNGRRESGKVGTVIPINYVALSKDER